MKIKTLRHFKRIIINISSQEEDIKREDIISMIFILWFFYYVYDIKKALRLQRNFGLIPLFITSLHHAYFIYRDYEVYFDQRGYFYQRLYFKKVDEKRNPDELREIDFEVKEEYLQDFLSKT